MDAGVLNVALTLGGELLTQVRGVLILDVLDNGVPAAVVVDQVSVTGGVDNVEAQTDAVLLDHVRHGLDLGGGADGLIGHHATLGVDEVGGEDGVDQGGLAQTCLACNVERQSTASVVDATSRGTPAHRVVESSAGTIAQRNSPTQMTLNWKPRFNSFFSIWDVMLSKPTWD